MRCHLQLRDGRILIVKFSRNQREAVLDHLWWVFPGVLVSPSAFSDVSLVKNGITDVITVTMPQIIQQTICEIVFFPS